VYPSIASHRPTLPVEVVQEDVSSLVPRDVTW
jgi:hypothetical protein